MVKDLEKNKMGDINKGDIGLKILNENNKSYDDILNKRIFRMYDKFSEYLLFSRAFGEEVYNKPYLLEHLLSVRQKKLLTKKSEKHNLSFEQKFNEFIIKLVSFESLWKNVFIDYVIDKRINEVVAMSFNFIKDGNIICYLRSHIPSLNQISYGLILDYWSNTKNFNEGCRVVDLSRGNEFYKYRLGAIEYCNFNFIVT